MDGPANRLKPQAGLDVPRVLSFGTPKQIRQIAPNYPVDPFRCPGSHPAAAVRGPALNAVWSCVRQLRSCNHDCPNHDSPCWSPAQPPRAAGNPPAEKRASQRPSQEISSRCRCRDYPDDNVTACRDNCPCLYLPFPKPHAPLACHVARSSAASNQAAYRPRQPRQASAPSTPPNCCGSSVRCDTRPATRPRQCHSLSRQMTRPMTP